MVVMVVVSDILLLVVSFDSMCRQGASKCFGFVDFEAHESAIKAVDEMNSKEIGDKQLYCGRAEKKVRREAEQRRKLDAKRAERQAKYQGVNLYVKNLDDEVDDDKLREAFSPYGTISAVKVMTNAKPIC